MDNEYIRVYSIFWKITLFGSYLGKTKQTNNAIIDLALPLGSMLPFCKSVRLIPIICGMASLSGIAANIDLCQ